MKIWLFCASLTILYTFHCKVLLCLCSFVVVVFCSFYSIVYNIVIVDQYSYLSFSWVWFCMRWIYCFLLQCFKIFSSAVLIFAFRFHLNPISWNFFCNVVCISDGMVNRITLWSYFGVDIGVIVVIWCSLQCVILYCYFCIGFP